MNEPQREAFKHDLATVLNKHDFKLAFTTADQLADYLITQIILYQWISVGIVAESTYQEFEK